jgi:hypothetical protein
MTKGTMQGSGYTQAILVLAILTVATNLHAIDWSTVPTGTFVGRAIAAIDAIPADEAERVPAELAAALNAGVERDGLTSDGLARIVAAAYGKQGIEPVALAKRVYPLLSRTAREPVAAAIVAGAPPCRTNEMLEVIRRLSLPEPPPLSRIVTRTVAIPWGKE